MLTPSLLEGDPREPLHRKSAFDLGECGAGQVANNLQLGCDCLGVIHYLDGLSVSPDGEPAIIPNAICIHEQDAGLGWKHTNIRTGRADVTRARELIFQLIVTVGNYEYALYWILGARHLLSSIVLVHADLPYICLCNDQTRPARSYVDYPFLL